ncbi:DUF4843 domain-containing protein [Chitinophaga flava]|uniref:DUF4843 domain-containing protein n=1 Tax=Chitinophaga flava TaxID=2259036 RepID=A0A365XS67_9BACT|nr:DUF4843 domain-containing protein [Chitinophaga flava]RBL89173.1 hypothetical protein DF182_21855 [Chitinophaga flava]
MKAIHYLLGAVVLYALAACKKDTLDTWKGTDDIYFENSIVEDAKRQKSDSIDIFFIFAPASTTDSVLRIPVKTMGAPVPYDRTFKIGLDSSTAVAGKHFDALPEAFVMRANRIVDTVQVRLHRTPDMIAETFVLMLNLKPNEYFTTYMDRFMLNNSANSFRRCTSLRIRVNDVLSRPKTWWDYMFSTFSRKKFQLICSVTGYDPAKLAGQPPIADLSFLGKVTQRYLKDQAKAGNVIYEDDGSIMTMGVGAGNM